MLEVTVAPPDVQGHVRPLVASDMPGIVALHERVFGPVASTRERLAAYLFQVFCQHPWLDAAMPSLVCEGPEGALLGCLGVMPRPMRLGGRPIWMAVSHHFMVTTEARPLLAGVRLLQAFCAGPQDLSLAEGNSLSRRIWEGLHGSHLPLYSLRWTRPLRPVRYTVSFLKRRGLGRSSVRTLELLGLAFDAVLARTMRNPFATSPPKTHADRLDAQTLQVVVAQCADRRACRPEYTEASLRWLLYLLAQKTHRGALRGAVVRDRRRRIAGCYLYHARPEGVAEVVQVVASERHAGEVLDHLFFDAREHGAMAVSGQVDPALLPALTERHCLLHGAGDATLLVHSRQPDVLNALFRGDAFLTRLEGEWWIGY
jgi:hypothetical protein